MNTKRSNVLISDIERPGRKFLREAMDTSDLDAKDGQSEKTMRKVARGLGGVLLGAPAAMYKDATGTKLSDEDKNELRREVTRGSKGEDSYKKGGSVGSASKRADGIATKGKTRGTMIMCGGGKVKK
jgi:hypothetical protein